MSDEPETETSEKLTPLEAVSKVLELVPEEGEAADKFSERAYNALKVVSDEDWTKLSDLSEDACHWYNKYHSAVGEGKKRPVFPGLETKRGRGRVKGEGKGRAAKPKVEKKSRAEKALSAAAWRIRELVFQNINMPVSSIKEILDAEEVHATNSTVSTTRASFLRSVDFLRYKKAIDEKVYPVVKVVKPEKEESEAAE